MTDSYRVERHPHGILIFGSVPVDDLVALSKVWAAAGMGHMDPGISLPLRANFAFCSPEHGAVWRNEIDARVKSEAGKDVELAWLNGTDTGTSSLTIFSVLSYVHGAYALRTWRADIPHDPADFGRCHRLLEKIPAWRGRLSEVAKAHPSWTGLVGAWSELTALYLEEIQSPQGRAPKLYARMKELK